MSRASDFDDRVAALLAAPGVVARGGGAVPSWPLDAPEPLDLAALYAAADGVSLPDGTVILPRGELAVATAWLTQAQALDWPGDLVVIGERDDLVIVLDLDLASTRAGGGVVEASTDALASFQRIARGVVGYLERRLGLGGGRDLAPEVRAREAVARRDAAALSEALAEPMYPGGERAFAHAALTLGALRAARGDDEASLEAFARSVAARVTAAPRGAGAAEEAAGWRACEIAAHEAGAATIAAACAARAAASQRR